MDHNRKGFAPLILIAIIAVAAIGIAGVLYFGAHRSGSSAIACPTDAKRCPDGSYVTRVGPHCEFGLCVEPSSTAPMDEPSSTTAAISRGTGAFCGGIAAGAFQCSTGYTCVASGTYPDAGGTCQIETVAPPPGTMCAQHVVTAKNTATGEVHDFPTPCQVPDGWVPKDNSAAASGLSALSDSQNLFTVQVPSSWHAQISETNSPNFRIVTFSIPNNDSLFTVTVFTAVQWQDYSSDPSNFNIPMPFLGNSPQYYFQWGNPQDIEDSGNITANEILAELGAIRASFRINSPQAVYPTSTK